MHDPVRATMLVLCLAAFGVFLVLIGWVVAGVAVGFFGPVLSLGMYERARGNAPSHKHSNR